MFQSKPYSAVTATIENLTAESFAEDDLSGIVELIEAIELQASGPTEAARAIRKKLKYGNVHRQVRALALLDGLIQNAGPRFRRTFADEPLLERLRVCGSSDLTDAAVRSKCRELFREWAQYAKTPGLERIARLHKELPKRKVGVTQQRSKVIRETEENPFGDDEEEEATRRAADAAATATAPSSSAGPSHKSSRSTSLPSSGSGSGSTGLFSSLTKDSSSKKHSKKGGKRKPFNLEAEKEQMKTVIAESSIASINLLNALQSINREKERISANQTAVQRFETCKQLRRRVLRYIHHVEHEQWLGGLLHANDELVHALMTYEQLDQSIDADSDSDDEIAEQAHLYKMVAAQRGKDASTAATHETPAADRLTLNEPSPVTANFSSGTTPLASAAAATTTASPKTAHHRPPVVAPGDDLESASEDEDEDDPFADSHAAGTPAVERSEPRW
ncbi:VHS domain-containing protein [Beauveria bassiana ARSEF 2860]|uniref:VHS domain-containing protein n=1 Tax=Beauveria bassiana (strain ARSEF 2860) TaxID=655819 RepID=J5JI94_BEAB2|nr:VHS domain-containing protein [Beauveria bassiana ARSEF 2860]EJP65293.1 VHS domain-containing protein [Beauveria bassiana ARSEF 2860]